MSDKHSKIQVYFVKPWDETVTFDGEVSPDCTGQMAIDGLLAGDAHGQFLKPASPGQPYELCVVRTGGVVSPNMTFREAGIINGDSLRLDKQLREPDLISLKSPRLCCHQESLWLRSKD